MIARAALALLALAAAGVRAQGTSLFVEISPNTEDPSQAEGDLDLEVGKTSGPIYDTSSSTVLRNASQLMYEFKVLSEDAHALYLDYQSQAAGDLKQFLKNISGMPNETFNALDWNVLNNAPESCRLSFKKRLLKIEHDAHLSAKFSAENHHKFFLGHMIVFRMHLNKSEDYIKKFDKIIQLCGKRCDGKIKPRLNRWLRLAKIEIDRVRDDIRHSRRSYRDLLAHAHRRLKTLRRQAIAKTKEAVEKLQACMREG